MAWRYSEGLAINGIDPHAKYLLGSGFDMANAVALDAPALRR